MHPGAASTACLTDDANATFMAELSTGPVQITVLFKDILALE